MFAARGGKVMAVGIAVGLGAAACGGKATSDSPGAGGSLAGSAGAGGSGGGSGGGAGGNAGVTGGGGTMLVGTCEQTPAPLRASGTVLEVPFELVFDGQPFVFGETNTVAPGQTVIPTNFRFYVSQVELLGPGDTKTAVDIVTATRAVQPYGVFLFNAESADAQTLRVLAPPGSYEGLSFAVGLTPACNKGSDTGRVFPLSADSQMTWPIPIGYLFLRYEGVVDAADGGAGTTVPRAIHMGGDVRDLNLPGAIVARVNGVFSVPTSGSTRKGLRVAVDQIFKGATSDVDLSGFPFGSPGDEIVAGERLRRAGGSLPLFTFGP